VLLFELNKVRTTDLCVTPSLPLFSTCVTPVCVTPSVTPMYIYIIYIYTYYKAKTEKTLCPITTTPHHGIPKSLSFPPSLFLSR